MSKNAVLYMYKHISFDMYTNILIWKQIETHWECINLYSINSKHIVLNKIM